METHNNCLVFLYNGSTHHEITIYVKKNPIIIPQKGTEWNFKDMPNAINYSSYVFLNATVIIDDSIVKVNGTLIQKGYKWTDSMVDPKGKKTFKYLNSVPQEYWRKTIFKKRNVLKKGYHYEYINDIEIDASEKYVNWTVRLFFD